VYNIAFVFLTILLTRNKFYFTGSADRNVLQNDCGACFGVDGQKVTERSNISFFYIIIHTLRDKFFLVNKRRARVR